MTSVFCKARHMVRLFKTSRAGSRSGCRRIGHWKRREPGLPSVRQYRLSPETGAVAMGKRLQEDCLLPIKLPIVDTSWKNFSRAFQDAVTKSMRQIRQACRATNRMRERGVTVPALAGSSLDEATGRRRICVALVTRPLLSRVIFSQSPS